MDDEKEDREAILSRRQVLIAGALGGVLVAAGGCAAQACLAPLPSEPVPPPPPRVPFSRAPGRNNAPHDTVPEAIRSALCDHCIYAAEGGTTSLSWQVLVSLQGSLLAYWSESPRGWQDSIDLRTLTAIVELADRAWREMRPPDPAPHVDENAVLAIRDGDDIFLGHPFPGSAAGALIARLRAEAERGRAQMG